METGNSELDCSFIDQMKSMLCLAKYRFSSFVSVLNAALWTHLDPVHAGGTVSSIDQP